MVNVGSCGGEPIAVGVFKAELQLLASLCA